MSAWREQTAERGNLFWLRVLSWIATTLGRGFLRLVCGAVALFFLISAPDPRRTSRAYLQRVLGRAVGLPDVWRHFYTFAIVSGDRLLFLAGKSDRFSLSFSGDEIVRQYAARGQGCVLLVSHVGSFDAMRIPAAGEDIKVRIVIDKQHNPAAMQVIESLNPDLARASIDAAVDASQLVLAVAEACSNGDMVGIMADRLARDEAALEVEFLGDQVSLPRGPWVLAMVLKVPVILCFAVYEGGNRYQLRFTEVYDGTPVARRQRQSALTDLAERYATELEHVVRAYPYNWFNFYDFWQHDTTLDN
tara:strand:+ start:29621 stop:30532 length:912 start_codon:yes stop_codon:yes gene_type:complete